MIQYQIQEGFTIGEEFYPTKSTIKECVTSDEIPSIVSAISDEYPELFSGDESQGAFVFSENFTVIYQLVGAYVKKAVKA